MSKLGDIAMIGRYLPNLNKRERVVLSHIADCHTARMGGNTLSCECGNREVHYNSCRDRHCPLCQGAARARWVKERLDELLPVSYFHVVFTIPKELHPIARANHKIFYSAGQNLPKLASEMRTMYSLRRVASYPNTNPRIPHPGIFTKHCLQVSITLCWKSVKILRILEVVSAGYPCSIHGPRN